MKLNQKNLEVKIQKKEKIQVWQGHLIGAGEQICPIDGCVGTKKKRKGRPLRGE